MNTNQIRKFATEARVHLLKGVSNSLRSFFRENGEPIIEPKPVQGGCAFGAQTKDEVFLRRWQSLQHQITLHGFRWVVEQVAYTWFNRLVAINILAKNNLAEPMLQFANPSLRVPYIVEQARAGHFPEMSAADIATLRELLNNDALTFEQFSLLIGCYCTANPVIRRCFGRVDDYSFLLLPSNILFEGEIVDMLNRSDLITDDDYRSPELIGWLYQFYISERKDEVFAKKGKFEADEIPAATQIFTPNWIVKYMVQNSLGRIYLDNEPYSELKERMQYLVSAEPSSEKFTFVDVRELTCADLACGSGHILNECFDLLYDIYIEQGYSRRDAVENIFAHNLIGIDIDTRAKQLATFALLLKACLRDASFADAHAMPRVLDMPEPYSSDNDLRDTLHHFFLGGTPKQIDETAEAIALFDYAEDLGSIMRFNISPGTREAIVRRLAEYRASQIHTYDDLFPYFDVILALTDRYAALVMNPPYMGSGNMNATLSKYVKDEYEEGKADLFSVFMLLAIDRLLPNGKYGMINMQSWMFLSSFEKLRTRLLTENRIDNMLHLGPRTFDELSGEVVQNTAFVITNCEGKDATGAYYRLIDGKNCGDKERMFLEVREHDGNRIYYPNVSQQDFEKIPESRIGYWVSNDITNKWENNLFDDSQIIIRQGLATGDNERFIRQWHEISFICFKRDAHSCNDAINSGIKWFPFHKGGESRSWYGNSGNVISFDSVSYNILLKQGNHLPSKELYFNEGLLFSRISSKRLNAKYTPSGFVFDGSAPLGIAKNHLYEKLGYMCSNTISAFLQVLSPTLTFQVGDVRKVAYVPISDYRISSTVRNNISISKQDWDVHETSWDFKQNELVKIGGAVSHCTDTKYSSKLCDETSKLLYKCDETSQLLGGAVSHCTKNNKYENSLESKCDETSHLLTSSSGETPHLLLEDLMDAYKQKWERLFMQLHANEEELNRQFIEIYGLQDELTPEVPLDEITILQQGEIHIENNDIVWHNDVIAKQLISYAIGCWMGRYRLDKPGLHIAHPNPTAEEVCTYTYNGSELDIDDDGIIPILSADSQFADNACHRVRDFLRIAFGDENLLENINFIETCLGKSIEAYFMKDFWKDHKKMYQNRPIYWLFSSKKGAFQCLAYMHRMDAYTVERVRSKYLLPHMDWLTHRINELRANDAMLTTAQRKTAELLEKELAECHEYHERLHYVADQQISFDLDDGVVVNYAKFGDILAKIK